MQNILKLCFLYIILCLVSSCKKENSNTQSNQPKSLQFQNKNDETVLNRITVHSKGYLVFANRNDLVEYSKLINSSSKKFALETLSSKGFHQKTGNFSITSRDEDSPYYTVFDQDGLLQVGDILMKLSSDEKFFYLVKEQNLDPDVFAKLLAEFYDELKMDKINVNRIEEEFDMFALVDYAPFGYSEPENSEEGKRVPCIGSAPGPDQCNGFHNVVTDVCSIVCCPTTNHYFFWILVSTTVSGDCSTTIVNCGNPT